MKSRQQELQDLIQIARRRLAELKKQQAYFGMHTPPHITMEIQDIEADLAGWEQALLALGGEMPQPETSILQSPPPDPSEPTPVAPPPEIENDLPVAPPPPPEEIVPALPPPTPAWPPQALAGYRPAAAGLVWAGAAWLPLEENASPPAGSALARLTLAGGQPAASITFPGVCISGLGPGAELILIGAYSLDPLQANGALIALDASGQEMWRWSSGAASVSAPAVVDHTVWLTTNTGELVAVDIQTGQEKNRLALGITPALAAPLIHQNMAYIPSRGPNLLALGLDGQPRWRFTASTPNAWLNHTPVVTGEYLITVYNQAGRAVALRLNDGQPVWETKIGPVGRPLTAPTTAGERVYVGARDGVFALNPNNGQVVWHFAVARGLEAAPVVSGGTVFIACRDHHLYALNAVTGQELWRYEVDRRIEVPPFITSALALVVDRGGVVTAIQRPLTAAEYETQQQWPEAAAVYVAQGQTNRAAELLAARDEPLKAAQLWHGLGDLEQAAQQYEVAGVWNQAAALWQQLKCPDKVAHALEQYAQALSKESLSDAAKAEAWQQAANAWQKVGQEDRVKTCRQEVARYCCLPVLEVEVEHEQLVLEHWTHLRFIIHNRGYGPAHQLIIRAHGDEFKGQVAETRRIFTLRQDDTRRDWLDVRPLTVGDVPLRLTIDYHDDTGQAYTWRKTVYVPVAESAAAVALQPKPATQSLEPDTVNVIPGPDQENDEVEAARKKDFFISYNRHDRQWAEWIAWQLEEAGYTTLIQAWDFRPGGNFVADMQAAASRCKRTIAVLSPDYLTSGFAQSEWSAAFAQDPTGQQGILLPVRVRECKLTGLLSQIVYVDLVGYDPAEALASLLAGVKRGRAKPSVAPGFPGAPVEQPAFPGETNL